MTLLENLMATLVFTTVATASLGIWSLGLAAEANRARQERNLDRIEAELNALDLRLRALGQGTSAAQPCATAAATLASAAQQQPTAEGVTRQVRLDPEGEGLWVTLAASGPTVQRERWFSPAALGLCGGWGGADAAL